LNSLADRPIQERRETDISFVELKALARRLLPKNSILLNLIMSEPDSLPRVVALAKVELFIKLLYHELN